jgi:hypothetical protein
MPVNIAVLPTLAFNESIDGSLAVHEADRQNACCIEDSVREDSEEIERWGRGVVQTTISRR